MIIQEKSPLMFGEEYVWKSQKSWKSSFSFFGKRRVSNNPDDLSNKLSKNLDVRSISIKNMKWNCGIEPKGSFPWLPRELWLFPNNFNFPASQTAQPFHFKWRNSEMMVFPRKKLVVSVIVWQVHRFYFAIRDSGFKENRVSENWWQTWRFWNYLVTKLPSNNSPNHENRLFWCLFSKTRFGETSRGKFHVVCAVLLDTPKPPQFQPLLLRWWP